MKEGRSPYLFDDEADPDVDDVSDFSVRESLSRSSSVLEADRDQGWKELQALADDMARDDDGTLPFDAVDDDVVEVSVPCEYPEVPPDRQRFPSSQSSPAAAATHIDLDTPSPAAPITPPAAGLDKENLLKLLQVVQAKASISKAAPKTENHGWLNYMYFHFFNVPFVSPRSISHMPAKHTNICFTIGCKQWPPVLRTPPVSSGNANVDTEKASGAATATPVEPTSALEKSRTPFWYFSCNQGDN